MKAFDVIIIGCGPAAIVTGITIKKFFNKKTVLIIKEDEKGLVPCGIPYVFHLLNNEATKNTMGPKPFMDLGGEVIMGPATEADPNAKTVCLASGEKLSYEKLVFATGSLPMMPKDLPGSNLENVFFVRKDFSYIHGMSGKIPGFKKLVIVGGGFIGAEIAEQLSAEGKDVTLVESESSCFSRAFSPELSQIATNALEKSGVRVITSCTVRGLTGLQHRVSQVRLSSGEILDTDAVIIAIGYKAHSGLAQKTGLELNRYNDIHVDKYGRTTVKDIYAVGDCAQTYGFLTGRSDMIKLASTATAEARILGHNIFGIRIKKCISGTLGVFSTEINGLAMAGAGANENNAGHAHIAFISAKSTSPDRHPPTIPDCKPLTIKLYASMLDGSIIGGEAWGGKSVGEIINTISMAIQKSITVFELVSFQMGTHPLLTPSPVNNPLVKAAEEIIFHMHHKD